MKHNTVTDLIMFMIQTGAIDANTGKMTDRASTHYTYESGRFTADEDYTNCTRDGRGYDEGVEREREKA